MPFFAYILRCADGTLYTGYTVDLAARIATHNAGKGGAYTRSHRPVQLAHAETFGTRGEAMRRECEVKRWSRARKEALIRGGLPQPGGDGDTRGNEGGSVVVDMHPPARQGCESRCGLPGALAPDQCRPP